MPVTAKPLVWIISTILPIIPSLKACGLTMQHVESSKEATDFGVSSDDWKVVEGKKNASSYKMKRETDHRAILIIYPCIVSHPFSRLKGIRSMSRILSHVLAELGSYGVGKVLPSLERVRGTKYSPPMLNSVGSHQFHCHNGARGNIVHEITRKQMVMENWKLYVMHLKETHTSTYSKKSRCLCSW